MAVIIANKVMRWCISLYVVSLILRRRRFEWELIQTHTTELTRRSPQTAQPQTAKFANQKKNKKIEKSQIRVYSRNKGPNPLQKKGTEKLDQRKDETFSFLYWPDSHVVGDFVCRGWCVLVCRKRAENLWRYARREREFFRTDFAWVFTLFFLRVRVTIPFFVFVFFWYSRFLTYHVFLLQTRSLRREQLRSNRRLDSIHNYKLRMARRDASFVSKWGGTRRSTW